jgi:hypothetical protein
MELQKVALSLTHKDGAEILTAWQSLYSSIRAVHCLVQSGYGEFSSSRLLLTLSVSPPAATELQFDRAYESIE